MGIFLALIRFIEPYVLRTFKGENSQINAQRQFSRESLCSFMNSAVNIEFVYIILVGINKFMETSTVNKVKISKNKQ